MKKVLLSIWFGVIASMVISAGDGDGKDKKTNEINSLSGFVQDKYTGEYLAGALVVLGNGQSVYTDLDGKFEFKAVQPGNYKLSVTYVSYHRSEIIVDTKNSKSVEVKLENKY